MVGGIVLEVCNHPKDKTRVYINCGERQYEKIQECAIYVENNKDSQQIEIGDCVWWQGRSAYWTPQKYRNKNHKNLIGGVHYDIEIRKIGYSGAKHPFEEMKDRDEVL